MIALPTIFRAIARVALREPVCIGLDIQDEELAAVALIRDKIGREQIRAKRIFPLAPEAIVGGELKRPEALKAAIIQFLTLLHITAREEPVFFLSLPPHRLYVKTALLPFTTEHELREAIRLQAETALPLRPKEAYIDSQVTTIKHGMERCVVMGAVAKSVLDPYLAVCAELGVRAGGCEFHLLSLIKLIHDASRPLLFALIDEDGVEFSVLSSGVLIAHYHEETRGMMPDFEKREKQLTSYAEGMLGTPVRDVFIFDRTKKEYVFTKKSEGAAEELFASPEIEPRFFICYGAACELCASKTPRLNFVPRGLGWRAEENLVRRALRLWERSALLVFALLAVSAAGMLFLLMKEKNGWIAENKRLVATVEEYGGKSQQVIENAQYFEKLFTAVEAARASTLLTERTRLLIAEAEGARLTIVRIYGGKAGDLTVSLIGKTREDVLRFEKSLREQNAFSRIKIPLQELVAEEDIAVTVSLAFTP